VKRNVQLPEVGGQLSRPTIAPPAIQQHNRQPSPARNLFLQGSQLVGDNLRHSATIQMVMDNCNFHDGSAPVGKAVFPQDANGIESAALPCLSSVINSHQHICLRLRLLRAGCVENVPTHNNRNFFGSPAILRQFSNLTCGDRKSLPHAAPARILKVEDVDTHDRRPPCDLTLNPRQT
jgi:hypothetical protein